MDRPDFLVLGQIVRPHGIRGEVKVVPFTADWGRSGPEVWVGAVGGPYRRVTIEQERVQPRGVLLKIAGVDSPERAATLVGSEVAIPRTEAPAPPEGSFYHYDVLGLRVTAGGRMLGSVEEILETPAHDVYVVVGPTGEWMLPATRAHIQRIDVGAGLIELSPEADVPGLLTGGEESS